MFDLNYKNFKYIIACDEVGRGPLAGPVVTAATGVQSKSLNKKSITALRELGIADSKKLSAKKRQNLLKELGLEVESLKTGELYSFKYIDIEFHFQLDQNGPRVIEKINILNAALTSMKKSSESILKNSKLKNNEVICLVDGNRALPWANGCSQECVIKGDSKSVLIGLASIIAKEYRDHMMKKYDKKYPGYGLASHAGYPTKKHKEAIKELGPTAIHRKTFGGVKEFVQSKIKRKIL
jgi:ribonuclease HII